FPHHRRLYTASRIGGQLRTAKESYMLTNHPNVHSTKSAWKACASSSTRMRTRSQCVNSMPAEVRGNLRQMSEKPFTSRVVRLCKTETKIMMPAILRSGAGES